MSAEFIHAVGKRKTATARVWLKPGTGKIKINKKDPLTYFKREDLVKDMLTPLYLTGLQDKVDVMVLVSGGGLSGQAGAVRHGIARALLKFNPDLKDILREYGLLTRDARKKERRKYGRVKARKSPQWTKR